MSVKPTPQSGLLRTSIITVLPSTKGITAAAHFDLHTGNRRSLPSVKGELRLIYGSYRLRIQPVVKPKLFKETSQYKAGFKMLLTGTPLQNNLEELFHLLYFVEPKAVTTFKSLTEKWAEMSKEERISSLHDQLKNHLLRRLKADVISDLPKKSEITVLVDMSVLQRKLYKLILTKNYEELRCGSLMNSLVHLQKVCDHPYLIPAGDAIAPRLNVDHPNPRYEPKALIQVSGKLVVLMKLLRGLRSGGHRVLIYSRMTTMLDILEEALANEEYAYERIDGRVKGPVRQIIIDRFNARMCEAFIFLLSTRAGGEGINLASADTVILYDSDWNPQCDLQALSRAHRIGQSRHVVVYRFVTRHSMEERVSLVARRKLALTDLVVNQRQQRIQRKSLNVQPLEPGTSDTSAEVTPGDVEQSEEQADTGETTEPLLVTHKGDQTSKGSVSNRLSRAEMDDLLRCGLEALFAVDDPLDEKDLQKAVAVTGYCFVVTGQLSDFFKIENSERLVYDDEAVARLLDRSHLENTSETPKSGIDDYLCTFRVAHFDPIKKAETTPINRGPGVESESAEEQGVQEQPTETLGYAAFWDKLLRERYQRLCAVEAETTSSSSRRVSKASWRLQQQTSYNSSSSSSSPDSDQEFRCWTEHTDFDGTLTNSTDKSHVSARSKPSNRPKQAASVGYRTLDICKRVRSNRRHPQGNPNGQSDSANERTKPVSFKHIRARRKSEEQRHKGNLSHDDLLPGLGEDSTDLHLESDEDPTYVPSGDEDSDDVLSHAQLLGKWRKREKNNTDNGTSSLSPSNEDLGHLLSETTVTDLGNICTEACKTAFWHPLPAVLDKWREVANKMGPKITWEYGHMFIYGFGPDDRQSFANAVMRYGLPPPGIVPPQDWLPPNLFYKSPPRVFAYMALFMQHLYDDPNAIDDSIDSWSDGLPKEKLCGAAVLARIAMMTLIRNKVMQFEDVNGVHSRTFEAVSTRFKFSINEGGLTLLRPTWYDEWQRINAKVEDVMPQSRVWNVATKKREEVMHHLQYTWHSRHDYWLLAGIHVHGYMRWADILADPRFHLLNTGLEGLLMDNEKKNGNSRWADVNSSHVNMAEAQAFLVTRLRLLEQALVVEQALYEVAKAALTGNSDVNQPQLVRVQSLAVCLSNKLASAGPRKRIALPRDIAAREATRAAVANLQEILEDIYADLPCLPASVICAEPETPVMSSTFDPPLSTTTSSTLDSDEHSITVERQPAVEDLPSCPDTVAATPTSAAAAGESVHSVVLSGDLSSSTARSPVHPKLSPPSPKDVDNNNKAIIEISDDDS
ncbi:chromodomain-helicase-DNA-binding protein 5 [Paragonimus westermani]|uniref:Chromodomain-helicase-DNA-binding protein 5 n=1 Tax=Paragonimus westermani TaxID=34504 RepID=A0A5J4NNX1_9TREM|nr:chromodomain-helicase-DNA-binding protein 5 [Paragonimus westermani]